MKKIIDLFMGLLMLAGIWVAVLGATLTAAEYFWGTPDEGFINFWAWGAGMVAGGATVGGVCFWLSNRYFPDPSAHRLKVFEVLQFAPTVIAIMLIMGGSQRLSNFWIIAGIVILVLWMVAYHFLLRAKRGSKIHRLMQLELDDLFHRGRSRRAPDHPSGGDKA